MMMTLKACRWRTTKTCRRTKKGLFDALDTWMDCLQMAALVLDGIQGEAPALSGSGEQGYANATELADYLVAKGVPFREARHIVGEAVVEAIRQGKPLEALPLADLQQFSAMISDDVYRSWRCNPAWTNVRPKAASRRSRWPAAIAASETAFSEDDKGRPGPPLHLYPPGVLNNGSGSRLPPRADRQPAMLFGVMRNTSFPLKFFPPAPASAFLRQHIGDRFARLFDTLSAPVRVAAMARTARNSGSQPRHMHDLPLTR